MRHAPTRKSPDSRPLKGGNSSAATLALAVLTVFDDAACREPRPRPPQTLMPGCVAVRTSLFASPASAPQMARAFCNAPLFF
jgi:hypothetical protein